LTVRLIVFDLDGTLLGADNRLSDYTVAVLEKAASIDGLTLMAASGRSRWAADLVLQRTKAIDYVICSNGAVLYRRSDRKIVHRRAITLRRMVKLYAQVNEVLDGACWAWETDLGIVPDDGFRVLGTQPGKELDELVASPELDLPGHPDIPIEQRLAGFGRIVRGLLAHPELPCSEVMRRLRGQRSARLSSSSATFLEVTAPEVHKGAMLRRVCARRGIDARNVVAFGDHLNDLTMLRWAGRGIAMKGAYQGVLDRVAERTDETNVQDGVALAIEKLLADR